MHLVKCHICSIYIINFNNKECKYIFDMKKEIDGPL